jgi:superfamily II DNA helicase RecQ
MQINDVERDIMPNDGRLLPFQRDVLKRCVLEGASVIVDAPTGAGKTLPCMVIPSLMARLKLPPGSPPIRCASDKLCFLIILSPLKGLIADMIRLYSNKYNITIMELEGQSNQPQRIMDEVLREGSSTRVFILCPESFSKPLGDSLYFSDSRPDYTFILQHCWGVVHDEAHDLALLDEFRTAFSTTIQLPAFSAIRLMLVSGTWTLLVVNKVKALLSHRVHNNIRFDFDASIVCSEPNRSNLYYAFVDTVRKISYSY